MSDDCLLDALKRLSTELARDPLLVQAGGGNTSVKDGPVLWVKASGRWLADADRRAIFVPVNSDGSVCLALQSDPALRPSIETALHRVMPQRFVVHLHAANSAATAVLKHGAGRFELAMQGGPASLFLPYAKPGEPLAQMLARGLADRSDVQIVLLQNHGLVVGADSAHEALALVREAEQRLAFPQMLPDPVPDAHLERALAAPLFPDQVVFLPNAASQNENASPGELAIRAWMHEVARRIPEGAELNELGKEEVADLLGWEAEHYRRRIDLLRA